MTNPTKNGILALSLLLIAFCAFVGISVFKTRKDVAATLNELRQITASKDPTARFDLLQRKYGSELQPLGCAEQFCRYKINLSNRAISSLHLVPYTELSLWFTVYDGSLQIAMLEYRTALTKRTSPIVHVQMGMCDHGCGVHFNVNPHGTTAQMWNGLVEFDTRATPQQRDAALALDLDCLARIGGCKDIVELLPQVWARTGPGTITSRLVGLSQRLEEAHGIPSPDDY